MYFEQFQAPYRYFSLSPMSGHAFFKLSEGDIIYVHQSSEIYEQLLD